MFPVYSKIQHENSVLSKNYIKAVRTIALITFPMMLGLIGIRQPLVTGIFGSQWLPIQPLILILAPVGLIQSIGTTVGPIFQAKGRTDWMMRWGLVSAGLTSTAFVIGLRWGVTGVALSYAIVSCMLAYPGFAIPFRLIGLPVKNLGQALWRTLVCSCLMLGSMLALAAVLPDSLTEAWQLIILVPSAVASYLLFSRIINEEQMSQATALILPYWSGLQKK